MRHGSLFSGIGGFDLAAEWMGWENIFHCEWNEFGKKVLKYYWPNSISYHDITQTDFSIHRGSIDIISGGFPCQPYSQAGKRLGKDDERHLFPEMLRAIREIKPTYVVGENVYGLTNWNGGVVFEEVCADLEGEGYEVQPILLPASGIGAPHHRMRCWFVARHTPDTDSTSSQCRNSQASQKWKDARGRIESFSKHNCWEEFPTQSPICGGDDGLPTQLDGITFPKWRNESIKAYGNAIVPQLSLTIFKAIQEFHNLHYICNSNNNTR